MRTCRVRVEEKEEFLVYTVLWTLTCHPYLESATALSRPVARVFEEGVLKLSARKRGKFFGMTTPTFL